MLRATRVLVALAAIAVGLPAAAGTQLSYEIIGYSPVVLVPLRPAP